VEEEEEEEEEEDLPPTQPIAEADVVVVDEAADAVEGASATKRARNQ